MFGSNSRRWRNWLTSNTSLRRHIKNRVLYSVLKRLLYLVCHKSVSATILHISSLLYVLVYATFPLVTRCTVKASSFCEPLASGHELR